MERRRERSGLEGRGGGGQGGEWRQRIDDKEQQKGMRRKRRRRRRRRQEEESDFEKAEQEEPSKVEEDEDEEEAKDVTQHLADKEKSKGLKRCGGRPMHGDGKQYLQGTRMQLFSYVFIHDGFLSSYLQPHTDATTTTMTKLCNPMFTPTQ
jgi:hypothetical protein